MKKLLLLLILIPVLIAAEPVYVEYDFYDAGYNIWEFVCNIEVPSTEIQYKMEDGKLTGKLNIRAVMRNMQNDSIAVDEWNTKSFVSQQENIKSSMSLLDRTSFFLTAGKFEFTLIVKDMNSNNKYTVVDTFSMTAPPSDAFMSEPFLAISAKADTLDNKFTRNGYTLIPNPSHRFSTLNPIIYIYSEFYNLPPDKDYNINYFVLSETADTVLSLPGKKGITPESAFYSIGGVTTMGLKDGFYSVVTEIISDSVKLSKSRIFSKETKREDITQKYKLTNEQLKYYNMIEYIATAQEMSIYNELDLQGKHNFLISFWQRRDPNPDNDILEALNIYIDRIKTVDKKYSSGLESGYESDRGRIYLKYGPPDESMINPVEKGYKSFENWIYYSNGGMQFMFMDLKGFGKYELVYTNIDDEEIPVNWSSLIDPDAIQFYRSYE